MIHCIVSDAKLPRKDSLKGTDRLRPLAEAALFNKTTNAKSCDKTLETAFKNETASKELIAILNMRGNTLFAISIGNEYSKL